MSPNEMSLPLDKDEGVAKLIKLAKLFHVTLFGKERKPASDDKADGRQS
jgi:hypothetical protein